MSCRALPALDSSAGVPQPACDHHSRHFLQVLPAVLLPQLSRACTLLNVSLFAAVSGFPSTAAQGQGMGMVPTWFCPGKQAGCSSAHMQGPGRPPGVHREHHLHVPAIDRVVCPAAGAGPAGSILQDIRALQGIANITTVSVRENLSPP